jgi:hypothetical protein
MENRIKLDFTPQLRKIYGKQVVKIIKKKGKRNYKDPILGFEELEFLLNKFLHRNTDKKNFYKNHKQFTRFLLITLELFANKDYQNTTNSFIDLLEHHIWEIEHIVSQKDVKSLTDKVNLHIIGNLTLITKQVNSDVDYSMGTYLNKKDYFSSNKIIEKKLYINTFFEDNASFSDSEIEARTNKLLNEFNNIFYKNGDCTQKNDFSIATFISKLNLKEY